MKIENYRFGIIKIGEKVYTQDVKLMGDKVFPHWWRKQGHYLYREDIEDILDWRPDYLVIGCGAYGAMKVDPELENWLSQKGIQYFILNTDAGVEKYNQLLQEGKRVAACFHLTC